MNLGVLIIIVLAILLVGILVMPRVRGIARAEKTTIERRAGEDRRQRNIRVPVDRRKRDRRAQDAAKAFVDHLVD